MFSNMGEPKDTAILECVFKVWHDVCSTGLLFLSVNVIQLFFFSVNADIFYLIMTNFVFRCVCFVLPHV